jgi:NifU-like protein involved in Fe-S cluster formation
LRTDFENAGSLENASIFVEAIGEKMIHCGNTGNYMQLFLKVVDQRMVDIKYLCSCEPTANVAVEVLCTLAKGKTLDEALRIPEEAFYESIGSDVDELRLKVRGLMELLHEGIDLYKSQIAAPKNCAENMQW